MTDREPEHGSIRIEVGLLSWSRTFRPSERDLSILAAVCTSVTLLLIAALVVLLVTD